jgi:hypothetical protein
VRTRSRVEEKGRAMGTVYIHQKTRPGASIKKLDRLSDAVSLVMFITTKCTAKERLTLSPTSSIYKIRNVRQSNSMTRSSGLFLFTRKLLFSFHKERELAVLVQAIAPTRHLLLCLPFGSSGLRTRRPCGREGRETRGRVI